jgi:hypothetical protein
VGFEVVVRGHEFVEQNKKDESQYALYANENHDITWIVTISPPGQIM